MNSANKTQVDKNLQEKSVLVSREFNAPVADVWRACTESNMLDKWWGPSPWHVETKSMNFVPGGHWLYAMVGPENEKHWARTNYIAINNQKSIEIEDVFCDENGNVNKEMPVAKGSITFTPTENGTRLVFKTIYATEQELQTIVEMGFEQGITICFDQLAVILEK